MAKQASKKKPSKKRPSKKKKKANKKKQFFKLAALILILSFAAAMLGTGLYFAFRRQLIKHPPVHRKETTITKKQPQIPPYEERVIPEQPRKETIPPSAAKPSSPIPAKPKPDIKDKPENKETTIVPSKPLVAIIIDDMGHHSTIGRDLIGLNLNLTFAFLPYAPHTQEQLKLASQRGRDIMLHIPMEPSDLKWDPGPDALYLNMTDAELKASFARNFSSVPMAIGVNNHMGSRFTQNMDAMHVFLREVQKHNIFYVDSITTPYSVGKVVAQELGIKHSERDIFLDNSQDRLKTRKQLDALIRLAKKQGHAIGIGHPHATTLAALKDYQRQLRTKVKVVGIHELVH